MSWHREGGSGHCTHCCGHSLQGGISESLPRGNPERGSAQQNAPLPARPVSPANVCTGVSLRSVPGAPHPAASRSAGPKKTKKNCVRGRPEGCRNGVEGEITTTTQKYRWVSGQPTVESTTANKQQTEYWHNTIETAQLPLQDRHDLA